MLLPTPCTGISLNANIHRASRPDCAATHVSRECYRCLFGFTRRCFRSMAPPVSSDFAPIAQMVRIGLVRAFGFSHNSSSRKPAQEPAADGERTASYPTETIRSAPRDPQGRCEASSGAPSRPLRAGLKGSDGAVFGPQSLRSLIPLRRHIPTCGSGPLVSGRGAVSLPSCGALLGHDLTLNGALPFVCAYARISQLAETKIRNWPNCGLVFSLFGSNWLQTAGLTVRSPGQGGNGSS